MVKKRLVKDLHRHIRLEVDGRLVELPPVEGIIILNILRYTLFLDFKFLIKRSSNTGREISVVTVFMQVPFIVTPFVSVNGKTMFSSWGSGSNPWGPEREDQFAKPTHYDGMLEVVGVTGVVHMGQIQSSLRAGIRIAQGGHVSA